MQKLGLSGLRSLEGFRSLAGPTATNGKPTNPKPSSDVGGGSYGSFANLKITAEKLVKEQASVKTDLEMTHTKLKKATEQINMLEAKLQQAVNENMKLKVKQTEDSKLWKGLDSKVSSTKTLCDQLTETLQQLASQAERAEEDKKVFEETLGKNSKALDEFDRSLHDTSAKLECAEQSIMSGKQEILRIKQEKEEMDRSYKEQINVNDTTIREKDSLIKQLEVSVEENKARLLCADSRLQCMEQELKLKQDVCTSLKENLADLTSENSGLKIEIGELKSRITDLQKTQEIVMVQHVEECQVAEDKIRRLESEAEISASNVNRLEQLSSELQGREELIQKSLKLESDNQELLGRVQSVLDEKSTDTESLQHEIAKRDLQAETFGKQISELRGFLDEKEQLYISSIEREKSLEEQKLQVQASLAATECQLTEAKKQYDVMLVGKQIELSKHLKELSLRNDQAINDIRKKYEFEKVEIISAEKEKAEKLIREMENKCNEKILENQRESERCLTRLKEEHGTVVARIQQDNEHKESTLRAYHKEELQRIRSQAENELKERLSSLRQEHQAQINSVNVQHEEDCQKLQDELELQKSKEEKQRALLQLQWKVMGENQQVDQEVSSKKRRDPYVRKESQIQLAGPETKRKDVKLPGVIQSPISNALRKVEKGTQDVPNHRKVTHHEYEVETANGRITKRRKTTKSTVMFGEPNTQKSLHNTADKDVSRTRKVVPGSRAHPANIGELFSEGSLNPYAEDPYAFD
uniref:Uncharacterized protein n=1 Tax=Avena sativa TaxID=4498 RepID=A0ACD5V7B1_AVESA